MTNDRAAIELDALMTHFEQRGLSIGDAMSLLALQLGVYLHETYPSVQVRYVHQQELAKRIAKVARLRG